MRAQITVTTTALGVTTSILYIAKSRRLEHLSGLRGEFPVTYGEC